MSFCIWFFSLNTVLKSYGQQLKAPVAMVRLRLYETLLLLPPQTFEGDFEKEKNDTNENWIFAKVILLTIFQLLFLTFVLLICRLLHILAENVGFWIHTDGQSRKHNNVTPASSLPCQRFCNTWYLVTRDWSSYNWRSGLNIFFQYNLIVTKLLNWNNKVKSNVSCNAFHAQMEPNRRADLEHVSKVKRTKYITKNQLC